jgi:hypothetical protein
MYMWGMDTDPTNGNICVLHKAHISITPRIEIFNSSGTRTGNMSVTLLDNIFGGGVIIDNNGYFWGATYGEDSGTYYLHYFNATTRYTIASYATDDIQYGSLALACDGDNNIYLFYTKETDGKIYYRKNWGSETAYTSGSASKPSCELHPSPSSTTLNLVYYTN